MQIPMKRNTSLTTLLGTICINGLFPLASVQGECCRQVVTLIGGSGESAGILSQLRAVPSSELLKRVYVGR